MKHCKHYLLFLLAGALLVLPVTYQYPISMDEVKNSITQYFNFNEETLKKAIPATIIALVVASGLYYLWKNRGTTTFEIEGRKVTQFPVYSQQEDASSGYHALLRGMQVVNALAGEWGQQTLEKELMQSNAIAQYFSLWKETVKERRGTINDDWLQDTDLEFLWHKQEQLRQAEQAVISKDVLCDFTAIDDFSWINPNIEYAFEKPRELKEGEIPLDKKVGLIQERLQWASQRKVPYFYIFGIGDSYEQLEKHWFALILYQKVDGDREYFIVDSMNKARNNDIRIINLIKAIEAPIEIEKKGI